MFCYQCQETAKNTGCTINGVCGKTSDVANLQDLLMYLCKGISHYSVRLREMGVESAEVNKFVTDSLFMTITNANFDRDRFITRLNQAIDLREATRALFISKGGRIEDITFEGAFWTSRDVAVMEQKATEVGVLATENEDIRSLRELTIYGLKGMAAYAEHAFNLKHEDVSIYAFMQQALVDTTNDSLGADELTALVLKTGDHGVKVMALLDKANTSAYGNPEITKVNIGVKNNPAILISGHDLRDMEDLLKQTQGTGVDVYTHSEMLPANYYPAFKKYSNFVGNYGSSWWKQTQDFESFNGPVLFTTNCIVPPKSNATYKDRIYTTGASGFPGFKHVADRPEGGSKDFSEIIEHAKKCASPTEIETGEIIGGFAHAQVFALADKIVDAVKSGAIRKFFVMAGCDGRMKDRNYYTEFAEALPKDTVILTAGCAKYRYNKLPLGDIGGIPRVLDAGQCNDSYSLAVIALKLKEIFNANDINELPIAYNIAWYEQKAVIVLLALLALGVKNIHLGPTLPGFLSPNVASVLVKNFGLAPIGTVDEDMKLFLG
ncbi:MAG: hydroxylamine reductase [Bacteroidetes bacterium GWE2_39_28]|nr:MAG: hydroxylamine reductase [Bacteroidetes bacterium GWE2_39_28]OFY12857.1 MAG: hydroxylamine reductase [Bacteroidetes bacterium GWF2_39_10]OFZ10512.1 MAG: hydroxylamine reductase [Bacteroidetes bacterium RIFOXYC2_FULL_39_11]HCT93670.1 hydroxylamine reductase [Rikenellaceae bacterium]HCV14879.1 hydroxylamine reductase [Rikenellaceae bacterium]